MNLRHCIFYTIDIVGVIILTIMLIKAKNENKKLTKKYNDERELDIIAFQRKQKEIDRCHSLLKTYGHSDLKRVTLTIISKDNGYTHIYDDVQTIEGFIEWFKTTDDEYFFYNVGTPLYENTLVILREDIKTFQYTKPVVTEEDNNA